jgi:F0F1-type ATP synthase membrane subunit b/b'
LKASRERAEAEASQVAENIRHDASRLRSIARERMEEKGEDIKNSLEETGRLVQNFRETIPEKIDSAAHRVADRTADVAEYVKHYFLTLSEK